MFNWGVIWEDLIPKKEDKVQEGPGLDCSLVTGALGVLVRPEVEVEYQLDQVGKMTGFGVVIGAHYSHSVLDNAKWGILFSFDWRFLNDIYFKLTGELYVLFSVGFGNLQYF